MDRTCQRLAEDECNRSAIELNVATDIFSKTDESHEHISSSDTGNDKRLRSNGFQLGVYC